MKKRIVAMIVALFTTTTTHAQLAYTIKPITGMMSDIVAIDNAGDLLIERQLVPNSSPAPLITYKLGGETTPVQCPGTTNDTNGEAFNNIGDIVGHCNNERQTFIANRWGGLKLLAFPGAERTAGYGVNDYDQVVGFYAMPPSATCCFLPPDYLHAFSWDPVFNMYKTIDNPLAKTVGGWTFVHGINDKGQIIGYYNTLKDVPWEQYQFIYDRGTFRPIAVPGAFQTHITGLNNLNQLVGWSDACGNLLCPFLYSVGHYYSITLPLPPNAVKPDGQSGGTATLYYMNSLNDSAQFVGAYRQVVEWQIDMFGSLVPSHIVIQHFVATPAVK